MGRLNFKTAILVLISAIFLIACKSSSPPYSNQTANTSTNLNTGRIMTLSFDGETGGCGNIFVYRATKDKTKVISVRADKDVLKLNERPQTFDIGANNSLEVYIDDFGQSEYTGFQGYCVDLIKDIPEPTRIIASKGKVTIFFSKSSKSTASNFPNATVVLENISFQNSNYVLPDKENIEIKDVMVGWLPG